MALGDFTLGSVGPGVADLQRYLREVGYTLNVDGAYGVTTKAAVLAFQQARGIRVDGIAGPETLVELSKARAERWRAPVMTTNDAAAIASEQPYPYAPGTGPGTKPASKWNGLVILLAIAVGAWFLSSQNAPRRGLSRVDVDDGDPEPRGKNDGDDDEEEDEEDEPDDDRGDDE